MERRLLLDVIIGQGAAIFKLLSCEDQALLIRRDPLLVLNLRFHIVDGVASFDVQSDGLARQRFHEDLHASTKAQHQMERRLLLDVIVRKGAAIFKLFSGKDQALLVWWDPLLVLNLRFHIVNGIASFDVQCNGLTSQCFHEDLHASTQTQHQVERRLLLDVVVG